MARTTGPLFSQEASGTVGKLVTHSSWKGRSYVRQAVTPTNPNSQLQISVRAMMAWITSQWGSANLTDANRASWADAARALNVPPFNAFLKDALENWNSTLAPRTTPTGPRTAAAALLSPTVPTVTAQTKSARIDWNVFVQQAGWGLFIFRETGATITLARTNLVAITPNLGPGPHTFIDGPLASGQYAYRFARSSLDGRLTTTPTTTRLVTIP